MALLFAFYYDVHREIRSLARGHIHGNKKNLDFKPGITTLGLLWSALLYFSIDFVVFFFYSVVVIKTWPSTPAFLSKCLGLFPGFTVTPASGGIAATSGSCVPAARVGGSACTQFWASGFSPVQIQLLWVFGRALWMAAHSLSLHLSLCLSNKWQKYTDVSATLWDKWQRILEPRGFFQGQTWVERWWKE